MDGALVRISRAGPRPEFIAISNLVKPHDESARSADDRFLASEILRLVASGTLSADLGVQLCKAAQARGLSTSKGPLPFSEESLGSGFEPDLSFQDKRKGAVCSQPSR